MVGVAYWFESPVGWSPLPSLEDVAFAVQAPSNPQSGQTPAGGGFSWRLNYATIVQVLNPRVG